MYITFLRTAQIVVHPSQKNLLDKPNFFAVATEKDGNGGGGRVGWLPLPTPPKKINWGGVQLQLQDIFSFLPAY